MLENESMYSHFSLEGNSSKIFHAFLNASNLQEFVTEVAHVIGNPVLVVDNVFKVLAGSDPGDIDDEVWKDAVQSGHYSDSLILEILSSSSIEDALILDHYPFERGPLLSSYKRIVSRLMFRGTPYGSVVVLCVNEVTEEAYKLIPFISDLVVKMSGIDRQDPAFRNTRLNEMVFMDLLQGNIRTHSLLQNRLFAAGVDKLPPHCQLLTILLHPSQRVAAGNLKLNLERFFLNCWVLFYEDHLLILRFGNQPFLRKDFSVEKVEALLEPYKLSICCSDSFTELLHLPDYYKRNDRAIQLAEYTRDSSVVISYDSYKFIDMALCAVDYEEDSLNSFVSEQINSILAYDKENGTDYFHTLHVFLQSDRSFVLAAKKLFTHKNTVAYRIGRMKELFNLDLSSGESVFPLLYSCMLVEYQNTISSNKAQK
ncbi:MAG: hypothetical protein E7224_06770 [Clostridiales bacterium]|nr:hypothetical protein [Clostridiales bacterium]